jgi:hypothetical protein
MSGPLDIGAAAPAQLITEQRRPNLFRQEFIFNDQVNVRAFDGKAGWSHAPFLGTNEPTVVSGEELKNLIKESDFDGPLVNADKKGHKVESLGNVTLDGRDAWKLKLTLAGGAEQMHYLDAETMLDVRVEGHQIENGQEVDYVQRFSDFREVEGVKFPHAVDVEQTSADGQRAQFAYRIEQVELDVAVEESRFAMPAKSATTKP